MNSQLQLVSNFISDSRMMLNVNKFNYVMWFHSICNKLVDYPPIVVDGVMDGVILKVVDEQKYLGGGGDI